MKPSGPRRDQTIEAFDFLRLWLRNPRSIGAVVPSGETLSSAIARQLDFAKPGIVVELGGGTGSITAALLDAGAEPADIVVIEREASLCRFLSARFRDLQVVCGNARDLGELLTEAQISQVKAVVSGLPLVSMARRSRDEIVRQAVSILPPDGVLVQFTYGLAPPIPRSVADEAGIVGRNAGWVLRNLPPAALWLYRQRLEMTKAAA